MPIAVRTDSSSGKLPCMWKDTLSTRLSLSTGLRTFPQSHPKSQLIFQWPDLKVPEVGAELSLTFSQLEGSEPHLPGFRGCAQWDGDSPAHCYLPLSTYFQLKFLNVIWAMGLKRDHRRHKNRSPLTTSWFISWFHSWNCQRETEAVFLRFRYFCNIKGVFI